VIQSIEQSDLIKGKKFIVELGNNRQCVLIKDNIILPGQDSPAKSKLELKHCFVGKPMIFVYTNLDGEISYPELGSVVQSIRAL